MNSELSPTAPHLAPHLVPRTPTPASRLPAVGTTIFTVMSALAAETRAVNLGQGFPDFDCDPRLLDAVDHAMRNGANQYAPMAGMAALREVMVAKIGAEHGRRYDPATEITVTAGATQAILTALLAVVHPGDEVIVLDPCYDSYVPGIVMAGGCAVRVPLTPGSFRPDFGLIGAALSSRTRAIIVNSPHNPSATVWTRDEMLQLQALLAPTDVVVISDEVYEHMAFDAPHESASRFDGLAARSFVVSSFGKTFHVTGWKVGTVVAPAALMSEFRKVHQFNVFSVNTPMQAGLAEYLQDPAPYRDLAAFYRQKREFFRAGLAGTRFRLLPCEGTYFQCVDISQVSELSEADFCQWLTRQHGVAAIPMSAFYGDGFDQKVVRFCFAKKEETLVAALERLQRL